MVSRTKRLAGVAVAAVAVVAGIPATTAGAAEGPCRAVSHSTGSEVVVVLEGHYRWPKSNSVEVRLTCHLVQNGIKVVSVTDPLMGPVAALLSDERLGTDPFHVCYSLYVAPPGGPLPIDHYSATDC